MDVATWPIICKDFVYVKMKQESRGECNGKFMSRIHAKVHWWRN